MELADIINKVHCADCIDFLREIPDETVDCIVTSPPYYGLRDYGVEGQIGLETTIRDYIDNLVEVFREGKRVLKSTGTIWVNIADSSAGSGKGVGTKDCFEPYVLETLPRQKRELPDKSLMQIPERLSLALGDELGLIKRNTIIWRKPNCMPASAQDRFTNDFEYLYFFTKTGKYWFEKQVEPNSPGTIERSKYAWNVKNHADKRERLGAGGIPTKALSGEFRLGRNKRCVWDINAGFSTEDHFAVFPRELVYTPIKAGCPLEICNACGVARRAIFAEKTNIRDESGNIQGQGRSKVQWNNSHPDYNPRFWSSLEIVGKTDCGCGAGFHAGIVLDPFAGTGTTCIEAKEQEKNYIGIELNPKYAKIANDNLRQEVLGFSALSKGGSNV